MSNSRTRYEISIAYTDAKGVKRYQNNVGNLWFDGERGSIQLPPGIALIGGDGHYINVSLPRPKDGDASQRQQSQSRGGQRGAFEGGDDPDNLPF